ncbi:hypothetical protein GPECTOR_6g847 [Gonium pectorale]|uniref:Glycosyl transferase CAP10 domain-containing protein n=1 Tax=Gonium pectorale TaxID=33097 RepID=A0A150GVR2_GONPE|nr:hypothetical protein GPECTOR_6g847 [Gonium pectorale]|eukprot:KXZ53929.1 hypothetical protein GPECTOR_6g847 [Gonium pectorale]
MAGIYRDNLDADFVPWLGRRYTVRQLYEMMSTLIKGRPQKYLSVVVVSRGSVTFLPLAARPMTLTISRMRAIVSGLSNATAAGLAIPDSIFLMNVWDEGRCYRTDPRIGAASGAASGSATRRLGVNAISKGDGAEPVARLRGPARKPLAAAGAGAAATAAAARRRAQSPPCAVPLFSLIKSWDYAAHSSEETDVLLPFFNHVYGNLVYYPWEKKYDKALMRAAMQAQMRPNSTRLWIMALQKNDPDGQRLLDAGITNNLSKRKDIQLANFVTIPDHARWKYLLSADGFTASCRLGKLMGTDSVVLKETTPWIEYYYRSLRPDVHFVPFVKDNVLQVLKSLEADQARCRSVAASAQNFTYTFLGNHSKALYVRRALTTYNGLFDDMAGFMAGLQSGPLGAAEGVGAVAGRAGGLTLSGLMDHMKAYVERSGRGGAASAA